MLDGFTQTFTCIKLVHSIWKCNFLVFPMCVYTDLIYKDKK